MTIDQLNEAQARKSVADTAACNLRAFLEITAKESPKLIVGYNREELNLMNFQPSGGKYKTLDSRPEMKAAITACFAIIRQALEAEALRTAKDFDDFTCPA